jgi:hypothetical protein
MKGKLAGLVVVFASCQHLVGGPGLKCCARNTWPLGGDIAVLAKGADFNADLIRELSEYVVVGNTRLASGADLISEIAELPLYEGNRACRRRQSHGGRKRSRSTCKDLYR